MVAWRCDGCVSVRGTVPRPTRAPGGRLCAPPCPGRPCRGLAPAALRGAPAVPACARPGVGSGERVAPPSRSDCSLQTTSFLPPQSWVRPRPAQPSEPAAKRWLPLCSVSVMRPIMPQGRHGGQRGARLRTPHPWSGPFRLAATAAPQSPARLFSTDPSPCAAGVGAGVGLTGAAPASPVIAGEADRGHRPSLGTCQGSRAFGRLWQAQPRAPRWAS